MGEEDVGCGGTDRDLEQQLKCMELAIVHDLRRFTLQLLTAQLGQKGQASEGDAGLRGGGSGPRAATERHGTLVWHLQRFTQQLLTAQLGERAGE